MKRNLPRSTADRTLIVLGLDPGTLATGYGIVERTGSRMRLLGCGSIRNSAESTMASRLLRIHAELTEVIERTHPDEFAIESAFYGKNAQSALKLGHARQIGKKRKDEFAVFYAL